MASRRFMISSCVHAINLNTVTILLRLRYSVTRLLNQGMKGFVNACWIATICIQCSLEFYVPSQETKLKSHWNCFNSLLLNLSLPIKRDIDKESEHSRNCKNQNSNEVLRKLFSRQEKDYFSSQFFFSFVCILSFKRTHSGACNIEILKRQQSRNDPVQSAGVTRRLN